MIRAHKIRLYPNNVQATYFAKACGCARLAYNWGLVEWKKQYEAGKKPSAYGISRELNAVKKQEFPFMYEVTKCAPARAILDLGSAFKKFFKKKAKYPRFKKKGVHDSFYIDNINFCVNGLKIRIPKLGWVRMAEPLRFEGKILSATVSRTADMWFVSISVEIPDVGHSDNQVCSAVGIDLGISKLATLSDGTVFENLRVFKKYERRLRRLNKSLSRKKKGSNNWKKAKLKLSRLYYKIACARNDAIHKMTRYIANNYSDICIEDLNVSGMVKNHYLSKALSDSSFREIRRQLEYKATRVHAVDRFFPSTKLCMECGKLHKMPLHKRVFECCAGPIDRDLHAAQNILRQGLPDVKSVETRALAS